MTCSEGLVRAKVGQGLVVVEVDVALQVDAVGEDGSQERCIAFDGHGRVGNIDHRVEWCCCPTTSRVARLVSWRLKNSRAQYPQ